MPREFFWMLPIVAILGLTASILEGFGIGLLIPMLSIILSDPFPAIKAWPLQLLTQFAAMFDPATRLVGVIAAIIGLIALKVVITAIRSVLIFWIEGHVLAKTRKMLSQKLLDLGCAFALTQTPARISNIIWNEAWRLSTGARLIFSIASGTTSILVFGTMLFLAQWKLFLLVGVGVASSRVVQTLYQKRFHRMSDRVTVANAKLASQIMLLVTSMRLVQIFGQEAREQTRLTTAVEQVRADIFAVERAASYIGPSYELFQTCLFVIALLLARALDVSVPIAAAFLILLYRTQPHLLAVEQSRLELATLRGSIAEVQWLLGREPETSSGHLGIDAITDPIGFERVTFHYSQEPIGVPALNQLDLILRPGRCTAIIGPSGSGKSTLVNLLCRLLEPTSGRIRVGDVDIAQIDPQAWRSRIALAGQDIELIDGTIAENIAYGSPDAELKLIQKWAEVADAHTFITALPQGYSTRVGFGGEGLSGGQRQRIGLARALLRTPDLLILDEATNAVDGISEATIIRLLAEHRGFRMAVVISHRQSTLAACEDGIVLVAGQVIEAGPLRSLNFYQSMETSEVYEQRGSVDHSPKIEAV
jgi:ATP-binding cassette, subfamily B, bacterial MsbA